MAEAEAHADRGMPETNRNTETARWTMDMLNQERPMPTVDVNLQATKLFIVTSATKRGVVPPKI